MKITEEDVVKAKTVMKKMGYKEKEHGWIFHDGDPIHPAFGTIEQFTEFLKKNKDKLVM